MAIQAGPVVCALALAFTALVAGAVAQPAQQLTGPGTCANGTACPYQWGPDGYGCCNMEGAVCCSSGYTCCPANTVCHDNQLGNESYNIVTTCVPTSGANTTGHQICKPGPPRLFNSSKTRVLVIGDSVSIGYTPYIQSLLGDDYDVMHSPDDHRDGGAADANYGRQCLDYFLRTYSGMPLEADLVMFNFGLHDLVTAGSPVVPGQSDYWYNYADNLTSIAEHMASWATASNTKLLFALTSAELCDVGLDDTVLRLNEEAAGIMAQFHIPTVNLHDPIVAKCGPVPQQQCFGLEGCWCPHCPPGYEWLANSTIVPAILQQLE